MWKSTKVEGLLAAAVVSSLLVTAPMFAQQADPLPSWNDGAAKKTILDFVRVTTDKSNPQFVPPEQRVVIW